MSKVYRIEHGLSGLGPFSHAGQISEVVNLGIRNDIRVIADIDGLPEVIPIIKTNPNALFGFNSLNACKRLIKNKSILDKYGFVIKEYVDVNILYVSNDNQVIFLK